MTPPYFLPPIIKAFQKSVPGSPEAKQLELKIRANIGDKDTLDRILGNSLPQTDDNETEQSSFDSIDIFLSKFSPGKVAGAYIPDAKQTTEQIDILRQLVKNKQYKEAIEIIEQGNLNNPQKNIYFADQMRFLRKLMALQRNKNI